jgi:hypothetical protein
MAQFINIGQIAAYSSFDGNIDSDSINPNIDQAQNNDIERVLGTTLYDKINADFTAGQSLLGPYLIIYNKYIVRLQVYYTCFYYLSLTVPKVSQNGAYFVTPEKTQSLTLDELERMATRYEKLAVGLELKFIAALDLLDLPERPAPSSIKAKSSFNWIRIK